MDKPADEVQRVPPLQNGGFGINIQGATTPTRRVVEATITSGTCLGWSTPRTKFTFCHAPSGSSLIVRTVNCVYKLEQSVPTVADALVNNDLGSGHEGFVLSGTREKRI